MDANIYAKNKYKHILNDLLHVLLKIFIKLVVVVNVKI